MACVAEVGGEFSVSFRSYWRRGEGQQGLSDAEGEGEGEGVLVGGVEKGG